MDARKCPGCGAPMSFESAKLGSRAHRFEDYATQCAACGIAYSNATAPNDRVLVHREPEMNVPQQVREGLTDSLAGAANIGNRDKKRFTFGFTNSEDAVTWTVFRGLELAGKLDVIAATCGHAELAAGPPSVLLWGHPVAGPKAKAIAGELSQVCSDLGEDDQYRSEPDVIVAWPALLVVAEAKFRSGNTADATNKNFHRYLGRRDLFKVPTEQVQDTGLYELVRNWVIGVTLAERLEMDRFVLANLGPERLESDCSQFSAELAQDSRRRFVHLRWTQLLGASGLPTWLNDYATEKELAHL